MENQFPVMTPDTARAPEGSQAASIWDLRDPQSGCGATKGESGQGKREQLLDDPQVHLGGIGCNNSPEATRRRAVVRMFHIHLLPHWVSLVVVLEYTVG